MAFGMRHWIALVGTLGVLVAAWKLPPQSLTPRSAPPRPTEVQARERRLVGQLHLVGEALRRDLWSDSLTAFVSDAGPDGVVVTAPDEADVPGGLLEELTRKVAGELARLGERPGTRFGFIYQTDTHAPYPHATQSELSTRGRTEYLAGTLDGRGYCLAVRVIDPAAVRENVVSRLGRGRDLGAADRSEIGACRPYLRYGLPGRHLARWLEDGAVAFALAGPGDESMGLPQLAAAPRRGMLGLTRDFRSGIAIDGDRCRAGVADACAAVMLDPIGTNPRATSETGIARLSHAVSVGTASPYARWLPEHEFLFSDLEREFGREAFRAFWTSDAGVAVAFEQAFGVDIGTWTVGWVDRVVGIEPPGPALPKSAGTGSALAMALLFAVAYARVRRRRLRI